MAVICHVILQNYVRFEQLYGYEPIKGFCYLAKFDIHRRCNSGDIIVLICHVILQNQVT